MNATMRILPLARRRRRPLRRWCFGAPPWLACLLLVASTAGGAAAQTAGGDAARAWFEDTYRRMRIEVPGDELAQLARLWTEAASADRTESDRRASFRALLDIMVRVQDAPAWRYSDAALDRMASGVRAVEGMASPPPLLPVPAGAWGEPGRLDVIGQGEVPLVLISDQDFGGSVYTAFAEANGDRFTSYVVTLAGAEGTRPPPLDGRVSETPWLDNAEATVLELVRSRGLDRPVMVGVLGGVYTAARLAIAHPNRFRAAVLLHGLVRAPRLSPTDPSRLIDEEERAIWADATLPSLFPIDTAAASRTYRIRAAGAAIDSARARELTERAARTHPAVNARYVAELTATDLHDDFAELRVPTLVIPSVHDPRSPVANTEMGSGQWISLARDYPDIRLTVVPFRGTRNFAPVDRPDELADAIEDFLDGTTPRGTPAAPELAAFQPSPATEVMRVLGATEVRVSYSAPGVKGREVWGGLVPWDRIWRAGANAATRMEFSQDVVVEGQPLEAGGYSFFVIPQEAGPWTLIFNRVDVQVGSFFHEPRHDALRIEVEPEAAPHQEWLDYRIEPQPPVEGRIVLHWGNRQVGFDVLAHEEAGMDRIPAADPDRLATYEWIPLGEDPADGARPGGPDGRSVSWALQGDTAWFRIQLHGPADPGGVGVNIAVDTDRDQSTGSTWWGQGSSFTYDRVATVWVMRSGDAYWGTVGVTDGPAAAAGDFRALGRGNLAFAMAADSRTLYVGAPVAALGDDGSARILVAAGTNVLWNDDLLGDAPPTLRLRQ